MRAPAGNGIEIQRHDGHQRLAFAGRHFRNAAAMQRDAADELHIVWHHVPGHGLAGDGNGCAHQPPACFLDGSKRFRQQALESLLNFRLQVIFQTLNLLRQPFPLRGVFGMTLRLPQLRQLLLEGSGPLLQDAAELLGLMLQLVIGQRAKLLDDGVYLRHQRQQLSRFALVARAEHFGNQAF